MTICTIIRFCPLYLILTHTHYSLADEVTPFPDIEQVVRAQQKNSPTTTYLIPAELRVPHVSLLKYLGEEKYMGYVDKFVGRCHLPACAEFVKVGMCGFILCVKYI